METGLFAAMKNDEPRQLRRGVPKLLHPKSSETKLASVLVLGNLLHLRASKTDSSEELRSGSTMLEIMDIISCRIVCGIA
jgi:hypothetical protein